MQSNDLEDLTLLLIRDANAPEMWIDRWAYSYPTVATISAGLNPQAAAHDVAHRLADISSKHIAIVAHGMGVWAWLAWAYQADIHALGKMSNAILVSPPDIRQQPYFQKQWLNLPAPCQTALVLAQDEQNCPTDLAQALNQGLRSRLLVSPHQHLAEPLQGWQWGMKLMQEMLLSK